MTTISPKDDVAQPSPKNSPEGEPESFGTWLRRQREMREIDLREIAETSKIGLTYLQAFEQDRFDILPAPIFAKGFLQQYARFVGLDPEEVINFYLEARRAEEESSDEPETERRPSPDQRPVVLALVLALVFVVGLATVVASLSYWSRHRTVDSDSGASSLTGSSLSPEIGGASENRAPESRVPATPEHMPTVTESSSDPSRSGEPSATGGRAAGAPGLGAQTETRQTETPLYVSLDFSSQCWIEVWVDGERRVSAIKVQGESLIYRAREAVELKVGDVDAVQVEVNGHPIEFEPLPGTRVRSRRIDLQTVAELAAATQGTNG